MEIHKLVMPIYPIPPLHYALETTSHLTAHPVKFGFHVGFDLGGSSWKGTGKVTMYDDQWEKIAGTHQTQVVCPDGAETVDDFLAGMARIISELWPKVSSKLKDEDGLGKTFVFYTPGQPTIDAIVPYASDNLKTIDGHPLRNMELFKIPYILHNTVRDIQLDNKKLRIIALNDMAGGTSAAIAQLAQQHPDKFKPGMDVLYLMVGGGFGVARATYVSSLQPVLHMDDNRQSKKNVIRRLLDKLFRKRKKDSLAENNLGKGVIKLELTELGNILYPGISVLKASRLEKMGASVQAMLQNFNEKLPGRFSQEDKDRILKTDNCKIVTVFDEAKKALPDIRQEEYETAARNAVEQYLKSLTYLTAIGISGTTTLAILSGNVADGVKEFVNQHEQLYASEIETYNKDVQENMSADFRSGRSVFDKVFLSRVWQELSPNGRDKFKNKSFDVVTDIKIPNNTDGTPYIAQGNFQDRSDWYVIPANAFLNPVKH